MLVVFARSLSLGPYPSYRLSMTEEAHEAYEAYEVRPARADEEEACWDVEARCWSPFHAEAVEEDYYDPALHVVAVDGQRIVATGNAVPFPAWDGDEGSLLGLGWADVQEQWRQAVEAGQPLEARYACAIGISVLPEARAGGLGFRMLVALRDSARAAGYESLAAPVRPSAKHRMPSLSYRDYALLRLPDGRHFDPWLRLHERGGGRIVGAREGSFFMRGSREEWEQWTGLALPEDGELLVDGGNDYLRLQAGRGEMVEGSIWVVHDLQA